MIEIIKEETIEERDRRKREEDFSLPRNIRQIGEVREGTRVYIEDYVMTYFKQLATYEAESEIVLILYGCQREISGVSYYFVSGAIRVKEVNSCLYNTLFNKEDWKKINDEAAVFFAGLSVLGWAVMKLEDVEMSGHRIVDTHEEFFGEKQPIFVQYMIADKEEIVYLYQNGEMKEQKGHYIYYERNEMMQNYLVSLREQENKVEEETLDHAAKQFRMVVQEKKEQRKKRKSNALLYASSLVLAFVIVLIGITMLNNYEKMQDMEKMLYQIANATSTQERSVDAGYNQGEEYMDEDLSMVQPTISQMESNVNDNQNPETNHTDGQAVSANSVSDNAIWTSADDDALAEKGIHGEEALEGGADTIPAENEKIQQSDTIPEETETAAQADGITPETVQQPDTISTEGEKASEDVLEKVEPTAGTAYQTYKIKWGDTLEKINKRFYGDVNRIDEICALNNIQNKDNICYGEKLLLPQ